MNPKDIQIPRKITNQILHQAQLSPDIEICGLIGEKNDIASSCYPVNNSAKTPETRFYMDEKQQINALATMRSNNEELFAIYHSHPKSPATPSATDIELAAYPDAVYLIISLNTKGVLEIRGFKISKQSSKTVEELNLSLMP